MNEDLNLSDKKFYDLCFHFIDGTSCIVKAGTWDTVNVRSDMLCVYTSAGVITLVAPIAKIIFVERMN